MSIDREAPDAIPWLSATERSAWVAVADLALRLPAVLDTQLQRDDELTFYEYMVLAMLSEEPDRTLQMSELAFLTSGSLSRLSHTAKRLEAAGYLTRERVPGGGRRTNARLTDAGYAKVVDAAPGHVREVRRLLFDTMTAGEVAALARVGRKFTRAIDPDGRSG